MRPGVAGQAFDTSEVAILKGLFPRVVREAPGCAAACMPGLQMKMEVMFERITTGYHKAKAEVDKNMIETMQPFIDDVEVKLTETLTMRDQLEACCFCARWLCCGVRCAHRSDVSVCASVGQSVR